MMNRIVLMIAGLACLAACELEEDGHGPEYYVRYHVEGKASVVNVSYRDPEGVTVFRPGAPGNQVIDFTRPFGGACGVVALRVENVSNDGYIKALIEVNRKRAYYAESDITDAAVDIVQYADPINCGY